MIGRAKLHTFDFSEIGLMSISSLIGVENLRRSSGIMSTVFHNVRDILPISLEKACSYFRVPDLYQFVQTPDSEKNVKRFISMHAVGGGRQRRTRVARVKRIGWVIFCLQNLNAMFCGGFEMSRSNRGMAFSGPDILGDQHIFALHQILEAVDRFSTVDPSPTRGLSALLDSLDIGEVYGTKSYAAENIIESMIALPAECSVVDASAVLYESLEWFENPEEVLIEDFGVIPPERLRPRKVWAVDSEWDSFCARAVERGLFDHIDFNDIFSVDGKKILSGAFAVHKPGKAGKPDQQRFILNLINEIFDISKAGEVAKPDLPYMASFTVLAIAGDEVLVSGSEDETCCFYLYRMPRKWRRFFALSKPYRDAAGNLRYVAVSGIPMGFTFAVGLLQCLQRYFISLAGGNPDQEIRPSRPFPDYENGESVHSLYVDNFNELRKLKFDSEFEIETALQKNFVRVKREHGVVINDDDHCAGELTFSNLGGTFDQKYLGVSRSKRSMTVTCLWLIAFGAGCSYQQLAAIVGIVSHCFLYRRQLFSIFEVTYVFLLRFRGGRWLPEAVRRELLCAASLLVFAEADLKQCVDPRLFASDASLWGGGFGFTRNVFLKSSAEAVAMLRKCDVKGTAIRLDDSSTREEPKSAVRIPLNDTEWKTLKAFPFGKVRHGVSEKSQNHITLLEGVTYTMLIRNLCNRVTKKCEESSKYDKSSVVLDDFEASRRIFVGLDSRGAMGAMAKGRSSARRLNRSCRKVCSCCLVSGVTPYFFWLPSGEMPMDAASRRYQPHRAHKESSSNTLEETAALFGANGS